jgi:hypothetical protein
MQSKSCLVDKSSEPLLDGSVSLTLIKDALFTEIVQYPVNEEKLINLQFNLFKGAVSKDDIKFMIHKRGYIICGRELYDFQFYLYKERTKEGHSPLYHRIQSLKQTDKIRKGTNAKRSQECSVCLHIIHGTSEKGLEYNMKRHKLKHMIGSNKNHKRGKTKTGYRITFVK